MKLIIAVIQPERLKIVQEMLHSIGVSRMTICDGDSYSIGLLANHAVEPGNMLNGSDVATHTTSRSKVVLEVFVNDDFVEKTIGTIRDLVAVSVGDIVSESEIFVIPSLDAITIDDEQRGPGAV